MSECGGVRALGGVSMSPKVFMFILESTDDFFREQACTSLYKLVQACTSLYKLVQACTDISYRDRFSARWISHVLHIPSPRILLHMQGWRVLHFFT